MSNKSNISEQLTHLIEQAIAAPDITNGSNDITDFHITLHADSNAIRISDDEDHILSTCIFDNLEDAEQPITRHGLLRELRQCLQQMDAKHAFDALPLFRPFSFVYEDTEAETSEDIYIVDSESMMLNEELLSGLDAELDEFLKHLIND